MAQSYPPPSTRKTSHYDPDAIEVRPRVKSESGCSPHDLYVVDKRDSRARRVHVTIGTLQSVRGRDARERDKRVDEIPPVREF